MIDDDLQNELIIIIKIISNSLSIIGTLFMTLMICFNKKFHTLGFYLIFNLSFSDLMLLIFPLVVLKTKGF
jgi:hypothetical protein